MLPGQVYSGDSTCSTIIYSQELLRDTMNINMFADYQTSQMDTSYSVLFIYVYNHTFSQLGKCVAYDHAMGDICY